MKILLVEDEKKSADGVRIVMPGMSGMEVLKTARREGVTTPVIMLTGVSEIENMVRDGSVLNWKELGENQFYVE